MRPGAVAVLAALFVVSPLSAQEARLPVDLKLSLLVRVMSFDRALETRADDVVVAVLYQDQVPASVRERDAWLDAERAPLRLRGKPVRVEAIAYTTPADLMRQLADVRATVIFLTPLRAVDLRSLAVQIREAGLRTATDDPALVIRSAAVALVLEDGRPHIVINMPLALAEGSDFSSQLLRVAEVLK